MAKSERHAASGSSSSTALQHQRKLQQQDIRDHVHMVEEYVLDEHDLNSLQLFDMPPTTKTRGVERTSRSVHAQHHHQQQQQQQQRHVRRSAELRTVSIIETLSELVSRTDNGHLTGSVDGRQSDCDGQCQQLCHMCPSAGRIPTLHELSPIPYWKSSAEKVQRQRPDDTIKMKNQTLTHGDQYGRDDGSGSVVPPLVLSSIAAVAHPTRRQGETPRKSNGGGGVVCFKNAAIENGIKKKTKTTLSTSVNIDRDSVKKAELFGREMPAMHRTGLLCNRPMRDSNHFMMSTLRSKGRTPDWIAGIFSIARRGNLEKLRQALSDMDATLIRNLSDHRGNNLFHVCCCYGHLECLQWLLKRGKQCEDAILDENKYELTPLVCAVKYGKTPCVEWLISNTIARGQLVPSTGSRPLIHWAAKYGQEVILRWLAEYMETNTMDVNVKDGYGNTSLHLAAKHGHATSIKALVTHRCDVSLKNDLGYKASDYAILYGQVACSEYLLSLEACLLMSANVASLDYDLNSAKAEITELKAQFKEVLSCAKKLVKEREELHQHLKRSEDGMSQMNKSIVAEIRALIEENVVLREKLNGSSKNHGNLSDGRVIDETTIAGLCHATHSHQRLPLPVFALSEIQQKILLAEEKWKRARARVTWDEPGRVTKEHMDVFRSEQ